MSEETEPLVEIDADEILNPPSIFSALTACKEARRMTWAQFAAEWKAFTEAPLFLALRDEVKISARRALSQLVVDPQHPCGKVPGSKELWTGVNLGHTYHLELLKKIPAFLDAQVARIARNKIANRDLQRTWRKLFFDNDWCGRFDFGVLRESQRRGGGGGFRRAVARTETAARFCRRAFFVFCFCPLRVSPIYRVER